MLNVVYNSRESNGGTAVGSLPISWWNEQYSDPHNVAFGGIAGEVTLFPLAGYQVTLHSFDLGAWPNTDRDSQVTLYDSTYNSLLGQYKNNVLQPIGD